MSTRSTIAVEDNFGVKQVYCHFDGYPSHNGNILVQHYTDYDKIIKLISYGDMSYLAPNVEPTRLHTYKNPQKDVVVYYGRDRGEENTQASHYTNFDDYLVNGQFEDYNYIWRDGVWWLVVEDDRLVKVSNVLNQKETVE